MEDYSVVGVRTPRFDTIPRALGEAKFSADLSLPGMLIGKVLRSPFAHARILHVDTSRAERLAGVKAVITGADATAYRYGVFAYARDQQLLPRDKVRFFGEQVAAVAAGDEDVAREALELIRVEYEPLPLVLSADDALKEGAPLVHDDKPGNLSARVLVDEGEADRALADSYLVQEDEFFSPDENYGWVEPYAVLASFDRSGLDIWCPNAGPHMKARALSNAFGIPTAQVRVRKVHVGGHYGGRSEICPIDYLTALLARKARRPVKIVLTAEENMNCVRHVHAARTVSRLGVTREGRITALDMKIIMDGGAYTGIGPIAASVAYLMIEAAYKIPNLRYEGIRAFTNKPPRGMHPHHPRTAYAGLEMQLDALSEKLGLDPMELRLRNAVNEGYVTPTRSVITSCAEAETLRLAAERAGWKEKYGKLPRGRGIGMSCSSVITGFPMGIRGGSSAFVKFNEDGDATVISGVVDNGQGNDAMIAKIAAEELGLPLESIQLVTADTSVTPSDPGSYSQTSTVLSGGAVKAAAADARSQLFDVAAEILEANVHDLVAKDGKIFIKGSPGKSIAIGKVARIALTQNRSILGRGERWAVGDNKREWVSNPRGQVASSYSFGTAIAEVEVDMDTGHVKLVNMTGAHDCGYPINPLAVEQQMQRAAMEAGPSGIMHEKHLWTANGQTLNYNFTDYFFPLATDVPSLDPIIVTSNDAFGPFGAKEGGASISVAMLGAVASAIRNAIGVTVKEIPMTPEVILRALQDASDG